MCSGLKINFRKSVIIPVGVIKNDPKRLAIACGCGIGQLPLKYLGVLIGVSPKRKEIWEPVILRIQKRLAMWKCKFLSFGGRVTLINSVLTSLPLYYMSIFKAPIGVIKRIDKIRRAFLWGGNGEKRKWRKLNG